MDRAGQLREEEKSDHAMRRTNRRSSWAQLNQRDAQDSLNNAIDKIQESLRKGSMASEVRIVAENLRTSSQGRKDGLSKQILLELQSRFLAVEETGQGLLDKDGFIRACRSIKPFADKMSEKQVADLFMKIDANSVGVIGFDDFTSFILVQQLSQEAEPASEHTTFIKVNTFGSKKFGRCDYEDSESEESGGDDEEVERDPQEPIAFKAEVGGAKRGNIDKIARAANVIEKTLLLGPLESYVTATQRGTLKLWSANTLKPLRAVLNGNGAWITDMVAMAHQPLAVFALDRSITFYDTGRLSFDVLGRIESLVNAPMCATWLRVAESDKLLYGDDQGIVHTYTFADEWGGDGNKGFGADRALPPGMTENIPWVLHTDWVTRIRFMAHSNSLMTASMDGNLLMLDFEKRVPKWTAKEHTHGIYGCEYCRSYNFIVTCGLERYINIWNPFTAKLMGVLHGHEASVLDVVVNETDNQIVSIGADSVIKVWDMRSSRCLQTIVEKTELPTRNNIMYDNERQVLLCGGSSLEMWHKRKARDARTSKICGCLYNSLFRQVVVGEVDSLIMVWSIDTGEDIFTFSDTQRGTKLAAMAFDQSQRRLLLGGQDGTLRMWNFNNGECLKEFHGFGQDEINAVSCLVETKNMFVIAVGWNKKVCMWHDGPRARENLIKRMQGHTDDVVCITNLPPSNIATGGCDGKIIIWKLDGIIKCQLRAPEAETADFDESTILDLLYLQKLGKVVVASIADGHLHFWRLHDSKRVYDLQTNHLNAPGPICVDANNEVIYTCDCRGYVKVWSLKDCHFGLNDTVPSNIPDPQTFRAHHEHIVSMAFADQDRLLVTTSLYGTIRLWTEVGVRIGQFGQTTMWDLSNPHSWKAREASYLSPPLHIKGMDQALLRPSGGRVLGSRTSRMSVRKSVSEGGEPGHVTFQDEINAAIQAAAAMPEPEVELTHEEKKQKILDYGPPWLRLESWYNPLRTAIDRQLPYKNLSSIGPLLPADLSDFAKEKGLKVCGPGSIARGQSLIVNNWRSPLRRKTRQASQQVDICPVEDSGHDAFFLSSPLDITSSPSDVKLISSPSARNSFYLQDLDVFCPDMDDRLKQRRQRSRRRRKSKYLHYLRHLHVSSSSRH